MTKIDTKQTALEMMNHLYKSMEMIIQLLKEQNIILDVVIEALSPEQKQYIVDRLGNSTYIS